MVDTQSDTWISGPPGTKFALPAPSQDVVVEKKALTVAFAWKGMVIVVIARIANVRTIFVIAIVILTLNSEGAGFAAVAPDNPTGQTFLCSLVMAIPIMIAL